MLERSAVAEEGQSVDTAYQPNEIQLTMHSRFAVDRAGMRAYGLAPYLELGGDVIGGHSIGQQLRHLGLGRSQVEHHRQDASSGHLQVRGSGHDGDLACPSEKFWNFRA